MYKNGFTVLFRGKKDYNILNFNQNSSREFDIPGFYEKITIKDKKIYILPRDRYQYLHTKRHQSRTTDVVWSSVHIHRYRIFICLFIKWFIPCKQINTKYSILLNLTIQIFGPSIRLTGPLSCLDLRRLFPYPSKGWKCWEISQIWGVCRYGTWYFLIWLWLLMTYYSNSKNVS